MSYQIVDLLFRVTIGTGFNLYTEYVTPIQDPGSRRAPAVLN